MGQIFSAVDRVQALTKTSGTTLTLGAGSQIRIGGQQYRNAALLSLSTATTGAGGLDTGALQANRLYAVYAVVSGGAMALVASLSTTLPTGFTAGTIVGYFDTENTPLIQTVAKDSGHGKVGDVKHSMLTEAQFQAENGPGWVLADSRSISGSRLHSLQGFTTALEARGRVLRGKNNGISTGSGNVDGDVALGTFQNHAQQPITGEFRWRDSAGALSNWEAVSGSFNGINEGFASPARGGLGGNIGPTRIQLNSANQVQTASENRMRNVTVNIFVKVN